MDGHGSALKNVNASDISCCLGGNGYWHTKIPMFFGWNRGANRRVLVLTDIYLIPVMCCYQVILNYTGLAMVLSSGALVQA